MEKTPEDKVQRLSQDQRHAYGFTGWSWETTKQNWDPAWIDSKLQTSPDFFVTFGVFFTAVTGIVAGANLSGDLKDPSSAIPKGTLLAIGFTYATYMYFAMQTGFVFGRKASGVREEFIYWDRINPNQDNQTLWPEKDPSWSIVSRGQI